MQDAKKKKKKKKKKKDAFVSLQFHLNVPDGRSVPLSRLIIALFVHGMQGTCIHCGCCGSMFRQISKSCLPRKSLCGSDL